MPTRKQRRRREKGFRHEYELVEIDPETGEERHVDAAALKAEKPKRERPPAQQAKQKQRSTRSGREPQPPSWRRVGKRTLIFAPLMALFIYWTQSSTKSGASVPSVIFNTAILIAFFGPFSYLVDSMAYRFYAKRAGKLPAKGETSKR